MKQSVFLLAGLCCALTACQDIEKKAATRLELARQAYEAGLYNEAKLHIDAGCGIGRTAEDFGLLRQLLPGHQPTVGRAEASFCT